MSDTLEKAAAAFDTLTAGQPAPAQEEVQQMGIGELFGDIGVLDADSPEAGGDDDIIPVRRKKEPKAQNVEADDEDESGLENDEDDPDSADDLDDDPDEGDEDGDNEEEGEEEPEFEVTVDGETQKVKLSEALSGYIRTETFYGRLNQLNEAAKQVQAVADNVIAKQAQYISMIGELEQHIEALVPAEPNWDEEFQRDPVEARKLQKRYNQLKEEREKLRAKTEETKAEQEAAIAEQDKHAIARFNAQILQDFPLWKSDPKRLQKDMSAIARVATTAGFTDEEVNGIRDPRMVHVLMKAVKYDRLMANKPKVAKSTIKPISPGAGRNSTAPKGVNKASQRLSRSGSIDDAAEVFTQHISRRR